MRHELVAYRHRMLVSVAAVNSTPQRARAALSDVDSGEVAEPEDRAVVERYARAFEAADVPGLVRLLADDAILEMPPVPLWFRGSGDYRAPGDPRGRTRRRGRAHDLPAGAPLGGRSGKDGDTAETIVITGAGIGAAAAPVRPPRGRRRPLARTRRPTTAVPDFSGTA